MRLKLIAPFHRPRAPRPFLPASVASPLPFFLRLAMTALRLDHRGFARHGWPANLLAQSWTILFARRGREFDPATRSHRLVDGFDNGNVDEAFLTRRLGGLVVTHALREIDQLGRELV